MYESDNMPKNPAEQRAQIDEQLVKLMSEGAAKELIASIERDVEKWYNADEQQKDAMITSLLDQIEQSIIANFSMEVQQAIDKEKIHEMMHSYESKKIVREGFEAGVDVQMPWQFEKIHDTIHLAGRVLAIASITVGIVASLINPVLGISLVNIGVESGLVLEGRHYLANFMLYCANFSSRRKFRDSLPKSIQDTFNKAIDLSVKEKPAEVASVDEPKQISEHKRDGKQPVQLGKEVKGMVANVGHAIEKKPIALSSEEQKQISKQLAQPEVDAKAIVSGIVGSQNPSMLARKAVGVFASIDNEDTSASKEDVAKKYVESFVDVCVDKNKLDACIDLAKHLDNCPKEAQILAAKAIASVANDEIQKSAGLKEEKQKQVEEVRKVILSNLSISGAGESQVTKLMQEKVREALSEVMLATNQPGKISGLS